MKQRQELHLSFETVLQELNPAQRQAVELIEGPLLVLAGPGTGKTHMLSARIGRILQQTDAQPENILCLTFTDAAAHAMRKRLLKLIGPTAYRVHIHTFHAFCYSILQEHPSYFNYREWQLISELERIDIIRELLDELPSNHLLKRQYTDPYALITPLSKLFGQMKKEGWSVKYVQQRVQAYTDSLLQRAEFYYQRATGKHKKHDLKRERYENELSKMQRFQAAATCYDQYIEKLNKAGLIEYDDMILLVLKAFQAHPDLLLHYQEQFLYLLVDEYQDTNSSQNSLLLQLISYWEVPNILIVGDDDQSIYEFQGARLKNLMDFYHRYKNSLTTTILTQNYRSTPPILEAAEALIKNNKIRLIHRAEELKLNKQLQAARSDLPKKAPKPQICSFATKLQEEAWVIRQIQTLAQAHYPLEQCAVIYARHRQSDHLQYALSKLNIPFQTKRQSNALDQPIVRIWRKLLDWLYLESQYPLGGEHLLYPLLQAAFWEIPAQELTQLAAWRAQMDKPISWHELLTEEKHLKECQLNKKSLITIHQIGQWLNQLLGQLQELPLNILLERSLQESGLIKWVLSQPQRDTLLNALYAFTEFAHRQLSHNPRLDLPAFMELLNRMDRHRIGIPIADTGAEKGIHLLTAHAAKGLEFDKVFIIGCTQQFWNKKGSAGIQFKIPDTLTLSGEEDFPEAQRRLFYVAITRAKNELYLSYAEKNEEGKNQSRTLFIDEMLSACTEKQPKVHKRDIQNLQRSFLQHTQAPSLPEIETALLKKLLQNFRLSITALNTYLDCPLAFYYRHLLKLPEFLSEKKRYGIAMHQALQRYFESKSKQKNKYLTADHLIKLYEQAMLKQQPFMRAALWRHQMEKGRKNLLEFYNRFSASWPEQSELELHIHHVEIQGVPIKGIIDRVDKVDKNTTLLIDYKTGKFFKKDITAPSPKNPLGGKFWRQLVFYKLLYDHRPHANWRKVTGGQIIYLEPDNFGRFHTASITLKNKEVQALIPLIQKTYEAILNGHFRQGCNKASCSYCNFHKDHQALFSLTDLEREELDDD